MIFLDVGAHDGQTLEEVTKPRYGFETIYAFEPMPAQYANLVDRFGDVPTVELLNYGLSNATGRAPLYGDNAIMESSIYAAKRDCDASVVTECDFVSATEFFRREIPAGANPIVKLNCEGAEIPILDDLVESGEIHRIANVMVDFDIRKVAGYEQEERRVLARLAAVGFRNYCLCEDVMRGATHQDRIAAWLDSLGEWE